MVSSDDKIDGALPTHAPEDALDASKIDAPLVAKEWLTSFGSACGKDDVQGVLELIWEDGLWYVAFMKGRNRVTLTGT